MGRNFKALINELTNLYSPKLVEISTVKNWKKFHSIPHPSLSSQSITIDPRRKKREDKVGQKWFKSDNVSPVSKMQGHKCIKEKIEQYRGLTTRQDSKERILDLPFTSLGLLKNCSDSFTHRASPKISRSRNSTRPNSCSEDELVYAMEKFPDFFPPEYLCCNDSTFRTAAEEQEILREKIHQDEEQIDRKVLDWLHQEYGI